MSDFDERRNENYAMSGLEDLDEPFLGNRDCDDKHSERKRIEAIWDEARRKGHIHWMLLFSNLIMQWAQWIANIVLGSGSFIARLLPLLSNIQNVPNQKCIVPVFSPLQEARLGNLQQRLGVPFDGSRLEHQDALKQLWRLAYPNRELPLLNQNSGRTWDGKVQTLQLIFGMLRLFTLNWLAGGGGFISLESLIFFAKKYPESFRRLLHKQDGKRADWEYPFAVAGINISFMLVQMLVLQSAKLTSMAGIRFLELLGEDEMAFDNLYCVAFQMMDAQWLAKRASYMEFNDVLKSTRKQLEHEILLEDVSSVQDLPAYSLLKR